MNIAPRKDRHAARGQEGFVQIVDVVKRFGDTTAVDHVDLSVRRGEVFALLGSSGCGKSTLLRMMAGLETPSSGRILIDGEDLAALPPYRRPVNMMFQSYALFPHMTVEANVAYGLKQEGVRGAELTERVGAALELVQMQGFRRRRPHQLSGGQQQRVALARSLVKRPKLLLLDEPMSALDKKIRQQTQLELGSILYDVGVTCVMVTHDQEEAMTMADRLAVMSQGRIVQMGEPHEVYEFPSTRFVADFIGSTNLFEGTLADDDSSQLDCTELAQPLALLNRINRPRGTGLTVSLRPERIGLDYERPARAHNWAEGVVEHIAYMGSYSVYHVRLHSGRLVAVNMSRLGLTQMPRTPTYDETVCLAWEPADCVVLGAVA